MLRGTWLMRLGPIIHLCFFFLCMQNNQIFSHCEFRRNKNADLHTCEILRRAPMIKGKMHSILAERKKRKIPAIIGLWYGKGLQLTKGSWPNVGTRKIACISIRSIGNKKQNKKRSRLHISEKTREKKNHKQLCNTKNAKNHPSETVLLHLAASYTQTQYEVKLLCGGLLPALATGVFYFHHQRVPWKNGWITAHKLISRNFTWRNFTFPFLSFLSWV